MGKNSEEACRRAREEDPSPGWTEEQMSCDQSYINTLNEYFVVDMGHDPDLHDP